MRWPETKWFWTSGLLNIDLLSNCLKALKKFQISDNILLSVLLKMMEKQVYREHTSKMMFLPRQAKQHYENTPIQIH